MIILFINVLQIKLLGQTLYYLLTTGAGQQTLGEEYCDISQVCDQLPAIYKHWTLFLATLWQRNWTNHF